MSKKLITTICLLVFTTMLLSMSLPVKYQTVPSVQQKFNSFFVKRTIVYSTIDEIEKRMNTKFNFIQRLKIKIAQEKIKKQLTKQNLLDACDLINFKNGEEIKAIVTEVGAAEIKYKNCDSKNDPTCFLNKADVSQIKYANGAKDNFENNSNENDKSKDVVNSNEAKTDELAIASIATGGLGLFLTISSSSFLGLGLPLGLLLILTGMVLGIVSLSKIKKSNGVLKGSGLALTGVIIGSVMILFLILAVVLISVGHVH